MTPSSSNFRHERRSTAPRLKRSKPPEQEQRRAYLWIGAVATIMEAMLSLSDLLLSGQARLSNVVGMLLAGGLSFAIYRNWVDFSRINLLVAYGNSLWTFLSMLSILFGKKPFSLQDFPINSLAVLLAFSWLPTRQSAAIALVLTMLLGVNVFTYSPQDLRLFFMTVFLNSMFIFVTYHSQRANQARARQELLEKLAYTDSLTGLSNRRGGWEWLEELMALPKKRGAVVLLDIDRFKKFNDHFGHATGDEVLRRVAQVLLSSGGEHAARWGGEEFLVVLPDADAQEARATAERIIQGLRALHLPDIPGVPVSAGVALVGEADTPDHLVALADERMYQAKQAGGDSWR